MQVVSAAFPEDRVEIEVTGKRDQGTCMVVGEPASIGVPVVFVDGPLPRLEMSFGFDDDTSPAVPVVEPVKARNFHRECEQAMMRLVAGHRRTTATYPYLISQATAWCKLAGMESEEQITSIALAVARSLMLPTAAEDGLREQMVKPGFWNDITELNEVLDGKHPRRPRTDRERQRYGRNRVLHQWTCGVFGIPKPDRSTILPAK